MNRSKKSIYNIATSLSLYSLNVLITFFSRSEFLDALGPEVLGLRYTIGNFFALTSIAELGLGSVIGFSLYNPLAENNQTAINEIISLQGWVYRKLALFEFAISVLFCIVSPFIFTDFNAPYWYIYASILVFAWGTISSYIIGYQSILLNADQKGYKLSLRTVWLGYLKNFAQLLILMYVPNPYPYYLGIELILSIAGLYILNYVVHKEYPWLRIDTSKGKDLYKKYEDITKKTKQMIVHKIGGVTLGNISPLIMTAFSSLTMIAFYDNYINLTRNLSVITGAIFGSIGAGIGNLVAEKKLKNTFKFFLEYQAVVHWISLIVCFALYNFSHPLVALWLGEQFIIDDDLLGLITIYVYISTSRTSRDSFIYAYGLVGDTWAPFIEIIINIGLSLIFGSLWGMKGVLIAVLISLFSIPVIWRSTYLFRDAFHLSPWAYWRRELPLWVTSAVFILTGKEILRQLNLDLSTYPHFFINTTIVGIIMGVTSGLVLASFSPGMQSFIRRIFSLIHFQK